MSLAASALRGIRRGGDHSGNKRETIETMMHVTCCKRKSFCRFGLAFGCPENRQVEEASPLLAGTLQNLPRTFLAAGRFGMGWVGLGLGQCAYATPAQRLKGLMLYSVDKEL